MNEQSLRTKGLQRWLPICIHTHTHTYTERSNVFRCVTDETLSGSVRGTVHSRQGWSGEAGRSHCTVATVLREKPAFAAWLLHRASAIWGSSHTLQTYLLNLDSLQKSQSLRLRQQDAEVIAEGQRWKLKHVTTADIETSVFQQDYIGFMDKNSADQSHVKKPPPRIPLNPYNTVSGATRSSEVSPC